MLRGIWVVLFCHIWVRLSPPTASLEDTHNTVTPLYMLRGSAVGYDLLMYNTSRPPLSWIFRNYSEFP